ncbi:uncharacterized protein LOC142072428 [Caretta caretta]|uniref:uncharacterized protein LOC142072428 n=1 Tax=Caretta caretta TaxID=8467 RepID=UPI003F4C721A
MLSSEWDSASSEADGRFCFVPGTTRDLEDDQEEERVDVVTEEAALKNILEQLPGQEKDEAQQLMFLHAIHPACLAAQQRGQDTLETHCCKAAVEERIVELIEELPDDSPPGAVLSNSLIAVGNLSTMTPTLEPALETHLLRAALHAVFTLGTEKDTTQVQDLHRVLPDVLDAMLGNPLAKSPDTNRLHYILENSSEFLRMAHHVAQLALFVGDPAKDITQQAREAVYRLYQLLLHQRVVSDLRLWQVLLYHFANTSCQLCGDLRRELGHSTWFVKATRMEAGTSSLLLVKNPRIQMSPDGSD